jgi:hypothetical protein
VSGWEKGGFLFPYIFLVLELILDGQVDVFVRRILDIYRVAAMGNLWEMY